MQKEKQVNMKKTLEDISKATQENNIESETQLSTTSKTTKYFVSSLVSGLFGFTSFFIIVIATEFFAFLLGNHDHFSVDMEDVMLSSIGFICFFLISLIKNFTGNDY